MDEKFNTLNQILTQLIIDQLFLLKAIWSSI